MADIRRTLTAVDWDSLVLALEGSPGGEPWYLDMETGQAFPVDPSLTRDVRKARTLVGRQKPTLAGERLAQAVARFLQPEGEHGAVEAAARVEVLGGSRYLPVPRQSGRDAWQDMADFADTVEDGEVARRLAEAIRGKRASDRFERELRHEPDLLDSWRAFRRERLRGRVRAWLEREGFQTGAAGA